MWLLLAQRPGQLATNPSLSWNLLCGYPLGRPVQSHAVACWAGARGFSTPPCWFQRLLSRSTARNICRNFLPSVTTYWYAGSRCRPEVARRRGRAVRYLLYLLSQPEKPVGCEGALVRQKESSAKHAVCLYQSLSCLRYAAHRSIIPAPICWNSCCWLQNQSLDAEAKPTQTILREVKGTDHPTLRVPAIRMLERRRRYM